MTTPDETHSNLPLRGPEDDGPRPEFEQEPEPYDGPFCMKCGEPAGWAIVHGSGFVFKHVLPEDDKKKAWDHYALHEVFLTEAAMRGVIK